VKIEKSLINESTYASLENDLRETEIVNGEMTYYRLHKKESLVEIEGYTLEIRYELTNDLDEFGNLQFEDTDVIEYEYEIRYLDQIGNICDEANHVYKAAYVGCTYQC
jgi:hypothetical protein